MLYNMVYNYIYLNNLINLILIKQLGIESTTLPIGRY